MIRRVLLTGLVLTMIVVAGGAAYVRLAIDDPQVWHTDTRTTARTGKPNDFLLADRPDADGPPILISDPPDRALARFDALVSADPRVETLVNGDSARTYVQRSAMMAFPDYISVIAEPSGTGTALSVYSRSRYGHSDLGVNRSRVERWREAVAN